MPTLNETILEIASLPEAERKERLIWLKTHDPKTYELVGAEFIPFLRKLLSLPQEERNRRLELIKAKSPEGYKRLEDALGGESPLILEALGYQHWLRKLGPHTFTGDFSDFHKDFWDWYWPITERQKTGELPDTEDITYLAIWGRGLGKSSNAEWLAIAEGCLISRGFVLYVCGTAEQAEAHVEAIRDRLEAESQLTKLYPGMRKPSGKGGYTGEHKQYGWRQDYLMTANGWAIRPVGLDKAIRGWKRGDARVSMIILDDIDDDDDSPEVILKKERRIAKKILPMGTARTKVVFAQNLIHSNSVLNRIHTRQTDILALRKGDEPIKSFEEIVIERGIRNVIKSGIPTWPFIDMAECQSFLDRSGYDAFMAEYQHDFTGEQSHRVLPEYDDRVLRTNVITWSQYEAKYGHRRIPSDWPSDVGLDIGYTTGHQSAWTFLTKAPEWVDLAGSIFRYRGRTFTGTGIDEQSVAVQRDLWPDEHLEREFMSHEKLGERNVLNQKHGWHFQPCDSDKSAGIAQWRHHLRADRTKPHPFHRDEKQADGLWKIGCPSWFDIVDDDQFIAPRDDRGLKTHRNQTYTWKMRQVEETKSGMTVEQPMKANEDTCFVAGTRILTLSGNIPIETLSSNDVVWTRQGWQRVEACGQTLIDAELWTLELWNGIRLIGTGNHPIWVQGYGWKQLSSLVTEDRVEALDFVSASTGLNSILIRTPNVTIGAPIFNRTKAVHWKAFSRFMLNYGNRLMVQFLRVLLSTIETAIHLTTPLRTWNLLPSLNTQNVMLLNGQMRSVVVMDSDFERQANLPWRGIEVKQGVSGIENTQSTLGLGKLKRLLSNAHSAIKTFCAVRSGDDSVLSYVRGASTVKSVKRTGRGTVYNLKVVDVPEYFANGVLVHNCDSTRCLTSGTSFGPLPQATTQAQKIQSMIPTGYHRNELAQSGLHPNDQHLTAEMAEWMAKQAMQKKPVILDPWGTPL